MIDSGKKSRNKYLAKLYDVRFRIPKERKEEINSIANDTFGLSLQQFILEAIDAKIETKMKNVEKFAGTVLDKRKTLEKKYNEGIQNGLSDWLETNADKIDFEEWFFEVNNNLCEILSKDSRYTENSDLFKMTKSTKPGKLMYYGLFDKSHSHVVCVLVAACITVDDLVKSGYLKNRKEFHGVLSRQICNAYIRKMCRPLEIKNIETGLCMLGIPYQYIFPLDESGEECLDGECVVPKDFLKNVLWK